MALNWKAFLEAAREVGALGDGDQATLDKLSLTPETDAKEPARWLVEQRLLTPFQAGTIYQGKAASLVLGNYLLLDRLGEGGFGQVFRARHRRMDRIVAVKLMSRQALASPQALQMFQREVKATARLVHPNIVTAFDADEYHGVHFFVMEHVEGRDLSWHVKKSGPLAPHLALNYIVQAARGLDHAHKHGVVHRDIKSSNLLLDQQGTIKILDLGIAQFGGESQDAAQQNAAAGASGASSVSGTVDYMAPEQSVPGAKVDQRADIYSLGCTFFVLLTAKKMYPGSIVERVAAHRSAPPPALLEARPGLPKSFARIFEKMVAKAPEDRYPTMAALLEELEPMLKNMETMLAAAAVGGDSVEPSFDKLAELAVKPVVDEATVVHKPTGKSNKPSTKNSSPPWIAVAAGIGVFLVIGVVAVAMMFRGDRHTGVAQVADTAAAQADPSTTAADEQRELEAKARKLKEEADRANLEHRLREAEEKQRKLQEAEKRRLEKEAEQKKKQAQDDKRKQAEQEQKRMQAANTPPAAPKPPDVAATQWILPPRRQPIPATTEVEPILKELTTQYGSARDVRATIDTLLDLGATLANDVPRQFANYEFAARQAAELGDLTFVRRTLVTLNNSFAIEPIQRINATLDTLKARVKGTNESLANSILTTGLATVPEALALEQFDEAGKLLATCESVRLAAKNAQLGAQIAVVKKQLDAARKLADDAREAEKTIQQTPDDPAANTTLGRFHCFVRRDWPKGLPYLQKSSDKDYHQLGEDGLSLSPDAAKRRELGERWLAKAITAEPKKSELPLAGAYFVSLGLPGLSLDERRRLVDDLRTKRKLVVAENSLSVLPLDEAQLLPQLSLVLSSDVALRLVKIQPGEFAMGSPPSEAERGTNEPQHPVKISRSFYLGESEVTQGQYGLLMNVTVRSEDANRPVVRVSWHDCQRYLARLNALAHAGLVAPAETGYEFRLPTEAEWEFACRAGTTGPFNVNGLFTSEAANFDGKRPYSGMPASNALGRLVDAKSYAPNAWGLYDMHGNAKEWCYDWTNGPYPREPMTDPLGFPQGDRKAVRGGDRNNAAGQCRSAARSGVPPHEAHDWLGFRVCYGPRLPSPVVAATGSELPAAKPVATVP
ncbi:MAG: SUMF1/EgtB/PvdO family nonheme iron enzyme [Planctomycetaceae bacterium]|nr:SUMF1/EgtB/PvdO family nonheme iron enzyme [Planctomycetaceae bacterium]